MSQSRGMSLVEAGVNVAIGFTVALLTQIAVFPMAGVSLSLDRHLVVGLAFTLVSLARSYLLRRLFERLARGGV